MKYDNRVTSSRHLKTRQEVMPDDFIRYIRQAYFAALTFVDMQVGRILQLLKKHELFENAVIGFISDHSVHYGDGSQFMKSTLYETAAHIPMMIRVPGMTGNSNVT